MEIYDLSDKEFKLVLLRGGVTETQENAKKKDNSTISGKE